MSFKLSSNRKSINGAPSSRGSGSRSIRARTHKSSSPTMGRKVRFAPQAARKSDIPDGPLRAQFRTHAPQQRTPYSLGSDDRYGVKDARTATIEPNEIDNMPLRAR